MTNLSQPLSQGLRTSLGCLGALGRSGSPLLCSPAGWGSGASCTIDRQDHVDTLQGRPHHDRHPRARLSTPPAHDPASILDHFADLPDPRREQGRIHRLDEIVFMATCAVFCGADTWEQIADYAHSKIDWLQTFLTLPGGIPSHDTFRRVFCLLDPLAFQRVLLRLDDGADGAAGIDPARRGSARTEADRHRRQGPTRLGAAHRRSIGPARRQRLGGRESFDPGASGHRRQIQRDYGHPRVARAAGPEGGRGDHRRHGLPEGHRRRHHRRGGQYVLAVKENQPHLYEDIERAFEEVLDQGEPGVDFTECQTEGVRSGRQETRSCCVITDPKGIRDAGLWAGLTAIVMVISHRVVNGVAGSETRYFIGSAAGTAEEYLRWVRGHWGIENSLHWVLDVCFREDDQRHWAGNSAENLAWLRKLALCLLKAEKNSKGKSIATRRLLAGWKNDYLLTYTPHGPE